MKTTVTCGPPDDQLLPGDRGIVKIQTKLCLPLDSVSYYHVVAHFLFVIFVQGMPEHAPSPTGRFLFPVQNHNVQSVLSPTICCTTARTSRVVRILGSLN